MRFLLFTDQGIEDLLADELLDRQETVQVRPLPYGHAGQVMAEQVELKTLMSLGTIHHVVEIRGEAEVASLAEIRLAVADIDIPEMAAARSYRVTSRREGKHDFRRKEIEGAAGAVLQERYGTPVSLEEFELNVRVDLYGEQLVVGLQRTGRDLDKRILRSRSLRTSIKPTLAAAMIRIAGAHRGEGRLIDPLCGGGTIPIEAKRINPRLEVIASDWDEETVATARATIANHALPIEVRPCDARNLARVFPRPFDYIVTDPPYGVRQARRVDMAALYGSLLPALEESLAPGGRLVIVALRRRAFLSALERTALCVTGERLVESGGLHPRIFLLQRSEDL